MADNLTKPQRRKNMQRIRSKGTLPERIIAKELRRRKIYFAQNVTSITGKPDIVFRRKKVLVFIDSDFWHGNPRRFVMPKSNIKYWRKKIRRNRERDKEVNAALRKSGWTVLRIWESGIKKNLTLCIEKIIDWID